jgi:DNA-directed RNA polymerase specialized sigma subunit
MGIKIDLRKNELKYNAMFPFHTKRGLLAILNMFNELKAKAYYESDYDALILLIDLENTMNKSNLTEKQKITIDLLYFRCLTQIEAAEQLNTTQQAILDRRNKAVNKMLLYNKKGLV